MTEYVTVEASKHTLLLARVQGEAAVDSVSDMRSVWNQRGPDEWLLVGYPVGHNPGDPHAIEFTVRVRKARAHECARCLQLMTVLERMTSVRLKEGVRKCDACRAVAAK